MTDTLDLSGATGPNRQQERGEHFTLIQGMYKNYKNTFLGAGLSCLNTI